MRTHLVRAAAAAALLTATLAPARADPLLGGSRESWPTEITRRPLTLAAGMVEVAAPVQLNASKDADWKPVTVNPSITFGLTNEWMIGFRNLVGLCLGGTDNGCPKVYNDASAMTRISVLRGAGLDVAVQGAVDVSPLSDTRIWAADAGVLIRAGGGAVALTVQPTVGFGLNERDTAFSRLTPIAWNFGTYDIITADSTVGNKEHLSVPATLQLQVGPTLALAAAASVEGPLNPAVGSFGDYYRIPVGVGAVLTPLRYLDVGATFTFPRFGGKSDTRDFRQLAAFVAFRI